MLNSQGTTEYAYDGGELKSITHKDASNTAPVSQLRPRPATSSETDNGTTINYNNMQSASLRPQKHGLHLRHNGNLRIRHIIGTNNELLSDGTWDYTYYQLEVLRLATVM